jgi:hypothetical protein
MAARFDDGYSMQVGALKTDFPWAAGATPNSSVALRRNEEHATLEYDRLTLHHGGPPRIDAAQTRGSSCYLKAVRRIRR